MIMIRLKEGKENDGEGGNVGSESYKGMRQMKRERVKWTATSSLATKTSIVQPDFNL